MINESAELVSFNNLIISKAEFNYNPSKESIIIYEVLRLLNGVPLFWEEHFNRLLRSLSAVNSKFKIDKLDIEKKLIGLICTNQYRNVNIRIEVFEKNILIYGFHAIFPSASDFEQGVNVNLIETERRNPNQKIFREQWKKDIEQKIVDTGVFELLVVNRQGLITEGSRSNVIFIRANRLFSAKENLILLGITRNEILKIAHKEKVVVEYVPLEKASISTFDAAFLCGTSFQIVPIAKLDDRVYNVNNTLLRKLQNTYNKNCTLEYNKTSQKWKI